MRALFLVPIAMAGILPAQAAELTMRRVMLSSAGVGYFEYEANVRRLTVIMVVFGSGCLLLKLSKFDRVR